MYSLTRVKVYLVLLTRVTIQIQIPILYSNSLCSVHRYLIKFIDGKFVTGEPPMIFSDFSDVVSYYKVNALEVMADKGSIFLKQPLLMKRQIK